MIIENVRRISNSPLVSILIPCHNCERYVGAAIESALNQSYKDIEVIVIDDGSTDNSRKVIDKYSEYIKLDSIPHQGACSARNRALELAQGEYIKFLDADDLLCPEKIELQVRAIEEGDLDWILCQGMHIDENGNDLPLEPAYPSANGCDPFIYLLNHPVQTNIPLHKRNTLKKLEDFANRFLGRRSMIYI